MNQELIDRIQQDAVTIQRLTAELDSIKQEQASNASDHKEKLQAEELRYSRLLSETSNKLIGCGKRIDSLENQLETVRKCARTNRWTEEEPLADFIFRTAEDRNEARKRLKAIYDAANALGRGEHESDESVSAFMLRLSGLVTKEQQNVADARNKADDAQRELAKAISLANDRAQEISKLRGTHADDIARIDKLSASLGVIESHCAECGRNDGETVCAFIDRQESKITELKSGTIKVYGLADTLGRTSSESIPDFMKRQAEEIAGLRKRIDRVIADRTPSEALKYQYDLADKLGRGTNERLTDFMTRQNAALDSQTTRINEVIAQRDRERQELQDKSQQLLKVQGWHEENLQKIRELEADPYRAFMKEELKTARAESLRARTELSEIAKIVNPEAENGPVIDFVQAMNNRLGVSHRFHSAAVQERNNAQEEVRKLSTELAKETRRLRAYEDDHAQIYALSAAAGMQGNESVSECLQRKLAELSTVIADRDRIRAELAAILVEANKSGRCNGDPVQLIKQGQADLDALRSMEHEYADQDTYIDKLETQIKDARADIIVTTAQRDSAERRVQELSGTTGLSGEINRLSALVAELQVELDDAKSQYGGIMAQLGNETPLQLIERMQRLAHDQRASTIPHDERAMLVAEIADLRKRLEAKTADHARVDYYIGCVRLCASNHGLRKGEELKFFINSKCNELAEALKTVESQSIAITEAHRVTEQYTAAVEALAKLKDWASTIRHKVLVAMVHTKAMAEYDTIMKELDGGKVPQ